MFESLLIIFVFFVSAGLTGLIYKYAGRLKLIAIPNERSSHVVPTPSGGGIAIAVTFLGAVLAFGLLNLIPQSIMLALLGGGLLIATIGLIDEVHPLKVRTRIFVHSIAAVWALWFVGGISSVDLGFAVLPLGMWGNILAFLSIVVFSNLYNFMDGIDGLIGTETIFVGGAAGIFLSLSGRIDLALVMWILVASTAGFLVWNWYPAKIFMGDIGSVLIGFSFAILTVSSENTSTFPGLIWVLLLSVVIIDAGLSTLIRALKGQHWFEAHRTFGYHRLVQRGYTHSQAVFQILGVNIVLGLIGLFLWIYPLFILPVFACSFVILGFVWKYIQKRFVK